MTTTDELEMQSATVADIAVKFPETMSVLDRYRLDYCCNGGRRFVAACENLRLDAGSVWSELMKATQGQQAGVPMRYDTWGTSFLIDYIVEHHHRYVRAMVPRIQELLRKVEEVHAEDHPAIVPLHQAFGLLAEELLQHMTIEEVIVFPTVRRISEPAGEGMSDPLATSILKPISVMENEHEEAGRLIKEIRLLTENYTPPSYACPSFQLTWKLLQEFDHDLMQHIHLENNILFPRVKAAG